jgi:hypothetical protein
MEDYCEGANPSPYYGKSDNRCLGLACRLQEGHKTLLASEGRSMNPSLEMIQEQIKRFGSGQIGITQMWTEIDSYLEHSLDGEDPHDPFEEDKAERRVLPHRFNQ